MALLHTPRLTLVPLAPAHLDSFHAVWSDPQATQWSLHGRCPDAAASRSWMSGVLRTPEHRERRSWAVYERGRVDPARCLGIVTLLPGSDSDAPSWQLGYLFRPRYWDRGFATESCRAAIDDLIDDVGSGEFEEGKAREDATATAAQRPRIIAWVNTENQSSSKVCSKLGFREVGRLRGETDRIIIGGVSRDNEVIIWQLEM